MPTHDVRRPRPGGPTMTVSYVLCGVSVVALGVFLVTAFSLAFGVGGAFVPMMVSGAVMLLTLAAAIAVAAVAVVQHRAGPTAVQATTRPGQPLRFRDTHVAAAARFSLGVVEPTGEPYLAIPVSNGVVDYEEHYRLSAEEYAALAHDEAAGAQWADRCRRHELDDRLVLRPGARRGIPT